MNQIWFKIETLAEQLKNKFADTGEFVSSDNLDGWQNYIYQSSKYRRAHVEIVDFRSKHNIYILHCTIFPHFNDPSPIWGFDAVCGPNKISGAFHDFSAGGYSDHFMMQWFEECTKNYQWRKPRQLPPWAQQIFSPSMIAAGNVREGPELNDLCSLAIKTVDYYLDNVGLSQEWPLDFHMAHNKYCYYQKQNPHVINSMVAMGIPKQDMIKFVDEVLFPETDTIKFA